MTVNISGPLFDEGGNVLANVTFVAVALDGLIGQDGGARAERGVTGTTDGGGVLDVDLKPGKYALYVNPTKNDATSATVQRIGTLLVLVGETSMTLEEALANNVQVSPGALIAAQQAAQDAANSASAASNSASNASNSATAASNSASNAANSAELAESVLTGFLWYIDDNTISVSVGVGLNVVVQDPGPGPYETITMELP